MDEISSVVLPARLEYLPALIKNAIGAAKNGGVDKKRFLDIELALEEILVNIMKNAYENDNGDIRIACRSDHRHRFIIEITDTGKAFDMTVAPPPDLSNIVEKREVGGLGIHLAKKVMDRIRYRREDNQNILEITIFLAL